MQLLVEKCLDFTSQDCIV